MFLLCGDGNEHITSLHNQLYEGEHGLEFGSAHPFKPHMTIATYDERADVELSMFLLSESCLSEVNYLLWS